MVIKRRAWCQAIVAGAVTYWIRPLSVFAGPFGIDAAITNGVNAGLSQAMGDLIEGLNVFFVPMLAIQSFQDHVSKFLGLDEKQRANLKGHRAELLGELSALWPKIANKSESERIALLLEEFQRLAPKYRELIMATLKPEQRQRLEQLERQFQGVRAMLTAEGYKQLDLTDEQRTRLTVIAEKLSDHVNRLRDGKGHLSVVALGRLLVRRKLADFEAEEVLTDQQRTRWREYTGEPIPASRLIPWEKIAAALEDKKAGAPVEK